MQSQKNAMRTRCHYSEMNLLRKRLGVSQVKTLVKENYMLSRECDGVYAGSFRRALSLAALICFQRKRNKSKTGPSFRDTFPMGRKVLLLGRKYGRDHQALTKKKFIHSHARTLTSMVQTTMETCSFGQRVCNNNYGRRYNSGHAK